MLKIGDFSKLAQVSVKTLRYYGDLGLIQPAWIDRYSGYRFYTVDQLPRLNRILALKDLGFSLEQIRSILSDDLSAAELRGMLRLKQAELERRLRDEQARLQRIEARMGQIEQEGALPHYEVVLKPAPSRQVAGIRQVLPGERQVVQLLDELLAYLRGRRVALDSGDPPLAVYYDAEYCDRGQDVEVAAPLAAALSGSQRVRVHELPAVECMACTVHRGEPRRLAEAHGALMDWIERNGYRIAGPNREVYLQSPVVAPQVTGHVTELQFPVQPKPTSVYFTQNQETSKMEPKIVEKPGFTALGMLYHGKNENNEIAQLWQQFNPRIPEIKNIVDGAFGVCGAMEEDGAFDYLAGFAVSSTDEIPEGMQAWEVAAQKYAIFPCTLKNIGETYRYAFDVWLPASEYEYAHSPDFEYYDEDFDKDGILYIYIPIK